MESTVKLLELRSEFSEAAGYQINVQKSTLFLYTSNKNWNLKCKNNVIYNSIKYEIIRYKSAKDVKDLC